MQASATPIVKIVITIPIEKNIPINDITARLFKNMSSRVNNEITIFSKKIQYFISKITNTKNLNIDISSDKNKILKISEIIIKKTLMHL